MQGHREEAKVIAKIGILPSCLSLDCISPLLWLSNSEHTLLPILNILSSSKGRKPSPIELLHPVQSPRLMQHTPLSEIWIWLCVTSQHMNQWTCYLPSDPPVLLLLLLLNRFGCHKRKTGVGGSSRSSCFLNYLPFITIYSALFNLF